MAEMRSLARPYARALFALAKQQDRIDMYGDILTILSAIMSIAAVQHLAGAQRESRRALLQVIRGALHDLPIEITRLLDVMSDNKRLVLVSIVRDLYQEYQRIHSGVLEAMVTCAYAPNEKTKEMIGRQLQERVKGRLQIAYDCEPALIGGFLVRIGDQVLDLSVREKMRRIGQELRR
ncbi:MAG: F0F1 ATP synthase subunit delta [Acidiferrobacter sp.]